MHFYYHQKFTLFPFLEHYVIAYNRILPQSDAVQYYIFLYSTNIK